MAERYQSREAFEVGGESVLPAPSRQGEASQGGAIFVDKDGKHLEAGLINGRLVEWRGRWA
jgi:hypothetical protein